MHIDFDSFFRNRIECLLIRASWAAALRSMLGLEKVSQVWNGNAGWYLWLQQAPGPYALIFSQGHRVDASGRQLLEGQFVAKCFPYPDDPGFSGFSAEERGLIGSDHFDATHTPCFEAETDMPDELFAVGSLSLICDEADRLALLTYQSLDALRISKLNHRAAAANPDRHADAPQPVRNVAGWDIGYPLFDCLVGLNTYVAGQAPAFIGVTRSEGFEYVIHSDGDAQVRNCPHITQTALTIGFDSSKIGVEWIETLWQDRVENGERVVAARRLPDSADEASEMDLPENITLNPRWWAIAETDFHSDLTTTCGCGHTHCHHTANTGGR